MTEHWRHLPIPMNATLAAPEGYRAPQAAVDAVNVALALGQPLLVTGEPGCGKSTLADWVAYRLGTGDVLRFQTRSTAIARDLFYHFDTVGRFYAAQNKGDPDPRLYILYTALGEAVLRALGRQKIAPYVAPARLAGYPMTPTRSVVLIDEIDKAPRDFPNDVLRELESFAFEITELGGAAIAAPTAMLPIVIITSNAERALPDAFLRRCVYHNMSFPDAQTLERIVYARVSSIKSPARIVDNAIAIVTRLRAASLRKPPGTAELLAFVLALRAKGFGPDTVLTQELDWMPTALTTLVKNPEDLEAAWRELTRANGKSPA